MKQPLRIWSNIERFGETSADGVAWEHRALAGSAGWRGAVRDYARFREDADLVVVNADSGLLARLCLLSLLIPRRALLVSLDLILPPVRTLGQRLRAQMLRGLLRQVDHYILYQKDIRGYRHHYGVEPKRAVYIPFKVNQWADGDKYSAGDEPWLMAAGQTYRDIPTLVDAARLSGVPLRLFLPPTEQRQAHGTDAIPADLPSNVEVVIKPDRDSWLSTMARARAIVVAIQPDALNAAGISTMLEAMGMGKPVIISRGPATNGIVSEDDVMLFDAGDAHQLADAMRRVHADSQLREALIARNKRLVESLRGEERLHRDILKQLAAFASAREHGEVAR